MDKIIATFLQPVLFSTCIGELYPKQQRCEHEKRFTKTSLQKLVRFCLSE